MIKFLCSIFNLPFPKIKKGDEFMHEDYCGPFNTGYIYTVVDIKNGWAQVSYGTSWLKGISLRDLRSFYVKRGSTITFKNRMKYKKKPVVIEAITFDELIEYGKNSGANIVNGAPWSFVYSGHAITHENDDCYLIATLEGIMKMVRGDMLITGIKGEIYPCKSDIFAATYDAVKE